MWPAFLKDGRMQVAPRKKYMKKDLRHIFAIAILMISGVGVFAQSQATTGTVQGTIVDPNGAVVSGATVMVKNLETGFERTVTTNSDGFSRPRCCRLADIASLPTLRAFRNQSLKMST